jgi:hypothetical protein
MNIQMRKKTKIIIIQMKIKVIYIKLSVKRKQQKMILMTIGKMTKMILMIIIQDLMLIKNQKNIHMIIMLNLSISEKLGK